MSRGLNFKTHLGGIDLGNENCLLTQPLKEGESNRKLLELYEKVPQEKALKKTKKERFHHLNSVFNRYNAYSGQEYNRFYKENKDAINERLHGHAFLMVFCATFLCAGLVFLSHLNAHEMQAVRGIVMGFTSLASLAFVRKLVKETSGFVLTVKHAYWNHRQEDLSFGIKREFFHDFLYDNNLAHLVGLKKKNQTHDLVWLKRKDLSRVHRMKAKDWEKINQYEQTRSWFKEWSQNGKVKLHEIEIRALVNMAKKYGDHMTPNPKALGL